MCLNRRRITFNLSIADEFLVSYYPMLYYKNLLCGYYVQQKLCCGKHGAWSVNKARVVKKHLCCKETPKFPKRDSTEWSADLPYLFSAADPVNPRNRSSGPAHCMKRHEYVTGTGETRSRTAWQSMFWKHCFPLEIISKLEIPKDFSIFREININTNLTTSCLKSWLICCLKCSPKLK